MKWMIASDIHGSAIYCKKLLERYKAEGAERLLLLGDLLYHGPRNDLPKEYGPKAVIEMLNGIKDEVLCVRGNCDTEVDQMVLEFDIMADYAYICDGECRIFATHGHRFNTSSLPSLKKGEVLLHGHTHVPACEEHEGFVYLNPGSVSIPKNGSEHSYMTFDGTVFEWKNLDGEVYRNYAIKVGSYGF